MEKILLILFAGGFVFAAAVRQEITIYPEPDQGGISLITIFEKIPDLSIDWKEFLNNGSSYCVTGYWKFFTDVDFLGGYAGLYGNGDAGEERVCNNLEFANYSSGSARNYGPSDTRTVALAIWEGSPDTFFGGIEVVVDEAAMTNFLLNTTSFVASFGKSNWTLFTETDFQGDSWCFETDGNIYRQLNLNGTTIRSVLRDCQ